MTDESASPVTVQEMYGDWDYEQAVEALERSLRPRSSMSLFDTVGALGIAEHALVLDIGGREGGHGLLMAERFGWRTVSVDPVQANLTRGEKLLAEHELGHLVELRLGEIESIPAPNGVFDLVLSRDMLGHVADTGKALAECGRVLSGGGAMVVHQVFATPLLEAREEQLLCESTATFPESLSVDGFERAVEGAGFSVESLDLVGSEWTEASQEAGTAPNYLLQISRLRRAKDELVEELGEAEYRVMYGNALWSIYQALGKLESRVYVLRPLER
jgi:ubiquinone/menaquinone biosynthesis C-methylase UbiE